MKFFGKKNIWILLLCLVMLFGACRSTKSAESETENSHKEQNDTADVSDDRKGREDPAGMNDSHKQLVMVYMVGSDLESETGMASRDITEILESEFDQENMTVLLCTGGTKYWWTEEISAENCEVYQVTDGSLNKVCTLSNKNMAKAETLTEFLDYGYQSLEADHYSLVMWDHGGGAVLGFGADENHDYDTLSLDEMDTAFQNAKLVTDGKSFEWIGFDACLMAMVEVADMLSGYADYFIASEEMEAGEGWDYSCLKVISDGEHFDGETAGTEIVKAYQTYYETNYKYTPDYTLVCMELSEIGRVVAGLENLVLAAWEELQLGGYSKIARMRDQTKTFGKVSTQGFYDTVDLYDLSEKMLKTYPKQAAELQTALKDLIVCKASNVYGAHGLAVYFPYDNKEYTKEWMTEYASAGFSDTYVSFLKSFTKTLSGKQLVSWDISETVPAENDEVPGEYYVQLTEEQFENFSHAKYSIWEEIEPGDYTCWINSSEVAVSEDGKISSSFQGKRFFIKDASGETIPCMASELERNEDYVKYAIPIMITPDDGEYSFNMIGAFIHLRVDEAHPEGKIIGIYETMDTDSTLFPNRNVIELKEGDIISQFYFCRRIIFREDGSVSPFDEWEITSGLGDSIRVTGELSVIEKEAEEQKEYCCLFNITDTQGNSYFTNAVYVQ